TAHRNPEAKRSATYDWHLRGTRFDHDAATEPPSPAALPRPVAVSDPRARRVPAAVRLRLRRHAGQRHHHRRGAGRLPPLPPPGIPLFAVAGAANPTSISVAKDITEGLIARFKTMRIWREAVLTGHVLSSLILTLISLAVVIAVALLIGYHTSASPLRWLAA